MPLAVHRNYSGIVQAASCCLLSVMALSSCRFGTPTLATEEQKEQALKKAKFDLAVIANRKQYEVLEKFILVYSDTLMSYNDKDSYVIEVSSADKIDTVLQKQDCYYFYLDSTSSNAGRVPDFLKLRLDSICKAISGVSMQSFSVCKDKEIEIHVKSEGGENGLYIDHYLIWNPKLRNYRYIANNDTLLSKNCLYQIGITEYHGH